MLTIPKGSVTGIDNSGTYTVTGTVQNTGEQKTGNVWVLTTFYNASGTTLFRNQLHKLFTLAYLHQATSAKICCNTNR